MTERGRESIDRLGTARSLERLETAKAPWFLWLHLIDPHGPYDSSPAERSTATVRTYAISDIELSKEQELRLKALGYMD